MATLPRLDDAVIISRVTFEPAGRRAHIPRGATVLEAARSVGVELPCPCAGRGTCGLCRVQVLSGHAGPATVAESDQLTAAELQRGVRLACQASVRGDARIEILDDSLALAARLQLEAAERQVVHAPAVCARTVTVGPPTREDPRSDARRVLDQLPPGIERVGLFALRQLPDCLRSARDWSGTAVAHRDRREVIAVLPVGSPILGLAVDLGTAKIGAYLVDLATGRTLASAGTVNPQTPYGEDVQARLAYAGRGPHGRERLRTEAVEAIDGLVAALCTETGAKRREIVDCVIVANTAMHHLVCGLPVRQLGASPSVPTTTEPIEGGTRDIDLRLSPSATLYLPPCIAGDVGADHVAVLAETVSSTSTGTRLVLDIGTGTDASVARDGRIWSCCTPSEPGLECGQIAAAMRAAPGAIEHVRPSRDGFSVQTIGDAPPLGFCGSGLLDAVAAAQRAGAIALDGTLDPAHPCVVEAGGELACVLVGACDSGTGAEIALTRAEIAEIRRATGAIRAAIDVLLESAGLSAGELDEVVLAGGFGTHLDAANAIAVGLLPEIPIDRVLQVGNAAGAGARRLLINRHERVAAAELAAAVRYVDLAAHPGFADRLVQSTPR
jgi:uncharacterized 2Fe-2S/4Fe-4S cluster protein (DUF4445 family)